MNHPVNSPKTYAMGTDTSWWEGEGGIPSADDDWMLDPEIPANYIPVIGEDELYMEIDSNGYIIRYHHRTQLEDGTWVWEVVNPDIPDNYEPVEGLENVYKVTDENGNIKYLRYIRNKDDTYAFIEVDENGNEILTKEEEKGMIPENYVHVTDNTYAEYNENGVLVGYKERTEKEGGGFQWITVKEPTVNKNDKLNIGNISSGISDKLIYESGGNMNQGNNWGGNQNGSQQGNNNQNSQQGGNQSGNQSQITPTPTPVIIGGDGNNSNNGNNGNTSVDKKPDGTYTEVETFYETKTSGGWTITYMTTITKTYAADGTLKSTKKDGPVEVNKEQTSQGVNAPDPSLIASTLNGEAARVGISVTYNTKLANELLAKLNAERTAAGLNALTMDTSSTAYKTAQILAADMAIYNHSDYVSPMYGTIDSFMNRFGIKNVTPSQNMWKTTHNDADDIHARFQAIDSSRTTRMSASCTQVGIAVVTKNGYSYVCEVLM